MRFVTGLGKIHQLYDAFLVDAWGVLHDGAQCYRGVFDCLLRLEDLKKPVIVLSNAARRHDTIDRELERLGISSGMYHSVVSSGELSWQALKNDSIPMGLGKSAYYLGPERSRSLCKGLSFEWVNSADEADWVLNTGAPKGNPRDATGLIPLLKKIATRQLPMICANPDQVALRKGELGISAGAIAKEYGSLGGKRIIYFGKPHSEVFKLAARQLKHIDKSRLLMVGDAFATDIAGAANYGIDSLLITSGIHAEELAQADIETFKRTAHVYSAEPNYICPNFCW
jgi:HAD superfamily hydrolase (TIGR01459 family)